MTKKKKDIAVIVVLLLLNLGAMAQKNAVYGTVGIFTSLNYEGTLAHSEEKGNKLALRINGGKIFQFFYASDDSYDIKHVGVSFVGLIGNNRSFFDVGLGGGYGWARKNGGAVSDDFIIPNVNLGYRYEFKRALFRIGIGIPELIYFSAGFRF